LSGRPLRLALCAPDTRLGKTHPQIGHRLGECALSRGRTPAVADASADARCRAYPVGGANVRSRAGRRGSRERENRACGRTLKTRTRACECTPNADAVSDCVARASHGLDSDFVARGLRPLLARQCSHGERRAMRALVATLVASSRASARDTARNRARAAHPLGRASSSGRLIWGCVSPNVAWRAH
jgi:hypothetical protein